MDNLNRIVKFENLTPGVAFQNDVFDEDIELICILQGVFFSVKGKELIVISDKGNGNWLVVFKFIYPYDVKIGLDEEVRIMDFLENIKPVETTTSYRSDGMDGF